MKARFVKVPILCGELTCCNYSAVGFATCHFLKAGRGKSKQEKCSAFNLPVYEVDGRTMRCRQCLQAEKRGSR